MMPTAPLDLGERFVQGSECDVQASRTSFGRCEQGGAKWHRKSDAPVIVAFHSVGHALLTDFAITDMRRHERFERRHSHEVYGFSRHRRHSHGMRGFNGNQGSGNYSRKSLTSDQFETWCHFGQAQSSSSDEQERRQ
jgi:hypothetical protein